MIRYIFSLLTTISNIYTETCVGYYFRYEIYKTWFDNPIITIKFDQNCMWNDQAFSIAVPETSLYKFT